PRNGGNEALDEMEQRYGKLPPTAVQLTGGGGRHFVFADTGIVYRSRKIAGDRLEIKADGSYIVAAPSVHPNGKPYIWDGLTPEKDLLNPALLPLWIIDQLEEKRQFLRDAAGKVPQGSRHDYLTSLAGVFRRAGSSPEAIEAALQIENR